MGLWIYYPHSSLYQSLLFSRKIIIWSTCLLERRIFNLTLSEVLHIHLHISWFSHQMPWIKTHYITLQWPLHKIWDFQSTLCSVPFTGVMKEPTKEESLIECCISVCVCFQALSNKSQHSISYTLSRSHSVIVEYTHDSNTDMFQVNTVTYAFGYHILVSRP